MSPDLGLAKIYLSIYNTENKQAVLLQMQESMHRLKQQLSVRIRKRVRRIPNIDVYMDETLDQIEHIDQLFDRIKKDDTKE